MVPWI